jgi:hypothetical protein
LSPIGLWGDVGDICNGGRKKESRSNSLKDSYEEKRPKRGGKDIGDGGYGKEDGPAKHKFFFRDF